jgi:hypothetical protein
MPVASDKPERHLTRGNTLYIRVRFFLLQRSSVPRRHTAQRAHTSYLGYLKTVPIASTKNLIFINKVLKTYSSKNRGKIVASTHRTGGTGGGARVGRAALRNRRPRHLIATPALAAESMHHRRCGRVKTRPPALHPDTNEGMRPEQASAPLESRPAGARRSALAVLLRGTARPARRLLTVD